MIELHIFMYLPNGIQLSFATYNRHTEQQGNLLSLCSKGKCVMAVDADCLPSLYEAM